MVQYKKPCFLLLILILISDNIFLLAEQHPVSQLIQQSMLLLEKLDSNKRRTRKNLFYSLQKLNFPNQENYQYIARQAYSRLETYPIFETIKKARANENHAVPSLCYQLLNIISQLRIIDQLGIETHIEAQKIIKSYNSKNS